MMDNNTDIDKRLLDYHEATRATNQTINAPLITNESLLQDGGGYPAVAELLDIFLRNDPRYTDDRDK